jgi:hypothetical protein
MCFEYATPFQNQSNKVKLMNKQSPNDRKWFPIVFHYL